MEVYLWAFVNFNQNNWARLLLMVVSVYKNAKNASNGHLPFKLNCGYHHWMLYKEKVDSRSKSKSADKLSAKLKELMIVCRENVHHAQEIQKRAHYKGVKSRNYAPGDNVWLNSRYIKTKRNQKLEVKFFGPFQILHPVGKQAYKLKLPRKWKIHDVFHVSMLKQDTTRTGRVDEEVRQMKFDVSDDENGEYEVEAIWNSALCEKVRIKLSIKPLLFGLMRRISKGRKYLGASFSSLAPQKAHQLIPQRLSWQVNAEFSSYWYRTTNG